GLNRLGAQVPLPRVKPFVGDKILRHAAIAALARSDDPAAFAPIVEAIADASRHVAETAVRAFGALHRALPESEEARAAVVCIEPSARERVVAATRAEDLPLRRGALAVLAVLGDPPSIELLVRSLADADVAEEIEDALVSHEDRSLPRLVAVARDANARDARVGALRLLGRFADRRVALETLRAALADTDEDVVVAAASSFSTALASGAAPTDDDVRQLLRASARKEPRVATTGLLALRSLARRKPE